MTPIGVHGDPAGGPVIAIGQQWGTVGNRNISVIGDPVTSHGKNEHSSPVMVQGSSWFTINGKPVCHTGDLASCGHALVGTQSWFMIA